MNVSKAVDDDKTLRGLASAILLRALKDFQSPAGADALFWRGLLAFVTSDWCETLCEAVGVDYDAYLQKCRGLFRRRNSRKLETLALKWDFESGSPVVGGVKRDERAKGGE